MRLAGRLTLRVLATAVVVALAATAVAAQSTQKMLRDAVELADSNRNQEALEILDQLAEASPRDADLLAVRAGVLRKLGRNEDARRDYQVVTEKRPRDVDAWFWLGTIDRWAGRDADAVPSYTKAVELTRCHLDALKGRARSQIRLKNDLLAEQDLRVALACARGDAEASELLAGLLAKTGRQAEAEAIAAAGADSAERAQRLGDVAAARGDWAEARARYREALPQRSESAPLHRKLGHAERELDRPQEALALYQRALLLDPSDTESLYWIGVLQSRIGTAEETLATWDELLKRQPDDVAALVGKARIYYRLGRREEALTLVERALSIRPQDADAHLLRGELRESYNQSAEARADYREVARADAQNLDAWAGLDHVGPPRWFGMGADYDRSEVVEGLEDAGVITPTGPIVPTRVEYETWGVRGEVNVPVSDSSDIAGDLSLRQESVTNVDTGVPVYDYDILAATGGMNHILSPAWRMQWRVGGTRYSPNVAGTVEEETHFLGSVRGFWRGDTQRLMLEGVSDSFVWRGFAGDTTFRIFTRNRVGGEWERTFGQEWFVTAAAGVADYDDGNTVGTLWASWGWLRGRTGFTLRYRHDPFPARFLTVPGNDLDFVAYDVLSIEGHAPLGAGFRISGVLLGGHYGATPRTIQVGDDLVQGPDDNNSQWQARAAIEWSPATYEPLTLGLEAFADQYAFDTSDYNNIDIVSWTPYVQLADDVGPRFSYWARYSHGFVDDERDPGYGSDALAGRVSVRLGSLDLLDGAKRLSAEGRLARNGLDEEFVRLRVFLTFPF